MPNRFVGSILISLLLSALVADPTEAAPAPPGAGEAPAVRTPAGVAGLRGQLADLRARLAKLDSLLDQVKDLYVRLGRLQRVVDRLERAAEAPADLDRRLTAVSARVQALGQRIERLRLARVRAAATPPADTAGVRAGYDGGFYVASARGRYKINVNGVLRTWLRVGQAVGPAALRPEEPVDYLTLGMPTGILMVNGNLFSKRLQYHIELEMSGAGFSLYDFLFHYRACDYFGLTLGQYPVAFSAQQVHDPYDILFADTSVGALMLGVGRDVGITLHFFQWQDRLFQELSVFNGGGKNTLENDNIDFLYQLRLGASPLGKVPAEEGDFRDGPRPLRLLVTGAYLFVPMPTGEDLDNDGVVDNSFVHQAGAQLQLVAHGFSFNGEFYYRYEDRGEAVTQVDPPRTRERHRFGGYAQAAYYIRPIHLAVGARYSYADAVSFWKRSANAREYGWSSPLSVRSDTVLERDAPQAVHEVGATVIFLAFAKHLKLMLNYSWLYERGYAVQGRAHRPSRQGHLATLMAQARF
jgi:hypothetical protein